MEENKKKPDGRKGKSGRHKAEPDVIKTQVCHYPRLIVVEKLGGHDAVKKFMNEILEYNYKQIIDSENQQ